MPTTPAGGKTRTATTSDIKKRRRLAKEQVEVARDALRLAGMHLGAVKDAPAEPMVARLAALERSCRTVVEVLR